MSNTSARLRAPKAKNAGTLATLLAVFAALPAATPAFAQSIQWDNGPPPQYGAGYASFSPQELDSLVAPIALFPDGLVAQILMAATYPNDVQDAADWIADPYNARLTGYGLTNALDGMEWDPSVKALTSAPQILRMLNDQPDWTQRLGEAFMADQGRVMDAVQRLRQEARANGYLRSNGRIRVIDAGGEIVIEPASSAEMYVEFYDPRVVYGAWAYPEYPPFYFPRAYYSSIAPIALYAPLWGWSSWDWRGRRLHVDVDRWRSLDRNRSTFFSGNTWRHDPGRPQGNFGNDRRRTNFDWRGNRTPNGGANNGANYPGGNRPDGRGTWSGRPQAPQPGTQPAPQNGGRDWRNRDRSASDSPANAAPNNQGRFQFRQGVGGEGRQREEANRAAPGNTQNNAGANNWQYGGRFRQRPDSAPQANAAPAAPAAPAPNAGESQRFRGNGYGQQREQHEQRQFGQNFGRPNAAPPQNPAPTFTPGANPGWQSQRGQRFNPPPQPQSNPTAAPQPNNPGQPNTNGDHRGRGRGGDRDPNTR